ncbi:hypothetical protein QQ045_014740 [Rhodiola kirilowii]
MLLDGLSNLEQDCESTTHQLCCQENPITEDHAQRSDECSVTFEDHTSIIFLKKESEEEVESTIILRSLASSDHYQLQHEVANNVASATAASSSSKIQMRSSLGQGSEENCDGFLTPIKFLGDTLLSSTGLKCPPAPRKPKAAPLGKRKRVCRRNLQVEFLNEVELVLRLLSSENPMVKRVRPGA